MSDAARCTTLVILGWCIQPLRALSSGLNAHLGETACLSRSVGTGSYGERVTTREPTVPPRSEAAITGPALAEPGLPGPTRPEPAISGPALADPDLSEPSPAQPVPTEPIHAEPIHTEPIHTEPIYTEPADAGLTRSLASADFASLDFVIVDVETTGWQPEQASITEIAAVRVSAGQPRAEFSALVHPGGPIPADIVALTGITDAMVSQAPPIGAVLPGFLAFARGCVLTAHHAPFDVGFLTAACGDCRIPWPAFPVLDTAALARSVLDETEVPDCKLATLAGFFGTRTRPCHRALADARATADVLTGLFGRLARSGVRTLAEISA
jgi:DNA polymerase III epsilon subunit family exonuclease